MKKLDTKNEAKRLRAITFAIPKFFFFFKSESNYPIKTTV